MPGHAEEDQYKDPIEVLKWSCAAINRFWRCVYGCGLWLSRGDAQRIVSDGWAFVVASLVFMFSIFCFPEVSQLEGTNPAIP